MFTTSIEKFADIYQEMKALNLKHYHEISEHAKHGFDLNPEYEEYFKRENEGKLICIVLRKSGQLVGYLITFVGINLHYKDCLQSMMDIIYVDPEIRGNSGGKMLIEHHKTECIRRGIKISVMGFKIAHMKYMENLLSECGYKPFEMNYSLWI